MSRPVMSGAGHHWGVGTYPRVPPRRESFADGKNGNTQGPALQAERHWQGRDIILMRTRNSWQWECHMTATPAKLLDTSALIVNENTAEAGFVWEEGDVSYRPNPKESTKVSLGKAPHVRVTDVGLFETYFPGVILQALDGTSVLVASQAVTRRMLKAVRSGAPKPTPEALRTAVINALRGIKNRGGVVIQIKAFGKVFKNQDEYMTFGRDFLAKKGIDGDLAEEILLGAMEEEEVQA